MPSNYNNDRVNLNDIADISESEFKEQITNWIEEQGVSKALQSKLRADLFEHFNKTNLGRQIALKHHHAHRLVLSPLLLVLNTLVAEFLYSEDCHFSLSVFSTEVPFKNALPDFEGRAKRGTLFRFSENELKDIFEAIQIRNNSYEEKIQESYLDGEQLADAANTSLLYIIFKNVCSPRGEHYQETKNNYSPRPEGTQQIPSGDKSQALKCLNCVKVKSDKFEIDSRYFKYLNRYLDILTDRVQEMSESLVKIHSKNFKSNRASDSHKLESEVKDNLNKIHENLTHLNKSKKKHRKFQDIVNGIEKLAGSFEKCGGNLESLLAVTNATVSDLKLQEERLKSAKIDTDKGQIEQPKDYSTWLRDLRSSENGKKFIARLEVSLQRTLDKEKEHLQKDFDEKMENYRLLLKLHYKQKYFGRPECVETGKEKEKKSNVAGELGGDHAPVIATEATNDQPFMNHRSILKEILSSNIKDEEDYLQINRIQREKHVEHIVESAKNRLKLLESESEKLDESFQAYLKRQYSEKSQFNEDVSKILQHYNMRKAMLGQHQTCKRTLTFNFDKNVTYPLPAEVSNDMKSIYNQKSVLNETDDSELETQFQNPFREINLKGSDTKKKKEMALRNIQRNYNEILYGADLEFKKFQDLEIEEKCKESHLNKLMNNQEKSSNYNSIGAVNIGVAPIIIDQNNNNDQNSEKRSETYETSMALKLSNTSETNQPKEIILDKIDHAENSNGKQLDEKNPNLDKLEIKNGSSDMAVPTQTLATIENSPKLNPTINLTNDLEELKTPLEIDTELTELVKLPSSEAKPLDLFLDLSPEPPKAPVIVSPLHLSDSLSDEFQLISTGPAKSPSPDDFW